MLARRNWNPIRQRRRTDATAFIFEIGSRSITIDRLDINEIVFRELDHLAATAGARTHRRRRLVVYLSVDDRHSGAARPQP